MAQGGGDIKSSDPCQRAEGYRTNGNVSANKGKYADACCQYKEGIQQLTDVEEADQERASELRLALHLNLALTQLRRATSVSIDIPALAQYRVRALLAAVESGENALAIDKQCIKAIYRRGCAYFRLGEHPDRREDVKRAVADFQKVLELDPENKDAASKLKVLEEECSWAFNESAQATGNGSAPETAGQSEAPASVGDDSILGAIRPPDARELSHKLTLSAARLSYPSKDKQILKDVRLDLRAGWSVGFVGEEGTGTTLAKLMCGRLQPASGRVLHHGCVPAPPGSPLSTAVFALVAFCIASLFLARAVFPDPIKSVALHIKDMRELEGAVCITMAALFLLVMSIQTSRRNANRAKHQIEVVTSNKFAWRSRKDPIRASSTIAQAIGEVLPKRLVVAERRQCVAALLQAAGFNLLDESKGQPYNDNLQYGMLSDVQKHLVHIVRCLATAPRVLICDEVLKGLLHQGGKSPSEAQVKVAARVLRMIRRLQDELNIAILYISNQHRELRLAADSLSVPEGSLGLTAEVLDAPAHPATAKYFSNCHEPSDRLAEFYKDLAGDADLSGPWLHMMA